MSKLYFHYGAMNSGKTTVLLQTAYNYEEKGLKILIIKPAIDTKGEDKIVSRLGIERAVDIKLFPQEDILKYIPREGVNAIIVDEAQFLTPEQVDTLYLITKVYNIPVLAYGLRCDFQLRPFPGAARLLQLADEIKELKTICSCGSKATQHIRLINDIPVFDGDQVEIDNQENIKYESVCGACYMKKRYGK